jgi:hypothetical protein
MYCPQCGGEYREGFTECADCEVPLVEQAPELEGQPDAEVVTVFRVGDPALVAFAESLLLEEGIPYTMKGERIQDLFALGRFPGGFNPITGPIEIQVPEEYVEQATEILKDLPPEGEEHGSEMEEAEAPS